MLLCLLLKLLQVRYLNTLFLGLNLFKQSFDLNFIMGLKLFANLLDFFRKLGLPNLMLNWLSLDWSCLCLGRAFGNFLVHRVC